MELFISHLSNFSLKFLTEFARLYHKSEQNYDINKQNIFYNSFLYLYTPSYSTLTHALHILPLVKKKKTIVIANQLWHKWTRPVCLLGLNCYLSLLGKILPSLLCGIIFHAKLEPEDICNYEHLSVCVV